MAGESLSTRDLLLELRSDVKELIEAQSATGNEVINLGKRITDHINDDKEKHEALDKRVSRNESWRNRAAGVMFVLAAIIGFAGGVVRDAVASVLAHWR